MSQYEFWKPIYLGSKGQKTRSRGTKNNADVGHGALMSSSFFYRVGQKSDTSRTM